MKNLNKIIKELRKDTDLKNKPLRQLVKEMDSIRMDYEDFKPIYRGLIAPYMKELDRRDRVYNEMNKK